MSPEAGRGAATGAGGQGGHGQRLPGSTTLPAEPNTLQTSPNSVLTAALESGYQLFHFEEEKTRTQRDQENFMRTQAMAESGFQPRCV